MLDHGKTPNGGSFFRRAGQKFAGILWVCQDFLTQSAVILAAKVSAEAIGSASYCQKSPPQAFRARGREIRLHRFSRGLYAGKHFGESKRGIVRLWRTTETRSETKAYAKKRLRRFFDTPRRHLRRQHKWRLIRQFRFCACRPYDADSRGPPVLTGGPRRLIQISKKTLSFYLKRKLR